MSKLESRSSLLQLKLALKHDMPASLTVFFVALPLCLGIALASGAPASSGILSGILGGMIVTVFSRSPLSVTGPAAGLTTLVAAGIATAGSLEAFLPAVVIAGALQVLLGALRIGGFVAYIPTAVIKGMLAGIGILLIGKQVPVVFGIEATEFWFAAEDLDFATIWRRLSIAVLLIAGFSLAMLIALPKWAARLTRYVPVPLLVVAAALVIVVLLRAYDPAHSLKVAQLVRMPEEFSRSFVFPVWESLARPEVWKIGIIVGLVASLETLLCVEAIDKLDPHRRNTPANRELIAQGAGNLACGLLGGIPVTAVIVRGAANVQAGARSRFSAFMHGVLLLFSAVFLVGLMNQIPLAALAAILLVTGYNLCSFSKIRAVWKLGFSQFLPFLVTALLVAGVDLLAGVLAGIAVSCYFILYRTFKAEYHVETSRSGESPVYQVRLHRNVTFLNKVRLKTVLDQAPEYSIIRLDGSRVRHIDYDVLEMISEYAVRARDRHIQLETVGIHAVTPVAAH